MDGVAVKCVSGHVTPTKGSAGVLSHVYGAPASVGSLAGATGGIQPGGVVQSDNK